MAKRTIAFWMIGVLTPLLFLGVMPGCSKSNSASTPPKTSAECVGVKAGTAWTPSVPGVASSNHAGNVTITKTTLGTLTAPIIGLTQAAPTSVESIISVPIPTDLGSFGSFTLIGQVTSYPSSLQGSAFPLLVSLTDPAGNEYINLNRATTGNTCATKGYYTCTGTSCAPSTSCTISVPSAYTDRTHWEQHQAPNIPSAANSPSVNTFPTCNWTGGDTSVTNPGCPFSSTLAAGGTPWFAAGNKLRTGTYMARYVLVSDSYPTIAAGTTAGLTITLVQKSNTSGSLGGAFDINFILVGDKNINSSRTAKGQQNLNSLVANMLTFYNQSTSKLKFGAINGVEWSCDAGAAKYATLDINDFNSMLAASSTLAPAGTEGKTINLFIVGSITSTADPGYTVLGYDGQINGPSINGTASSGVTASSFDEIDTFNASCTGSGICPLTQQDANFYQLSQVLTHELGHYLGLNHPSESDGSQHDLLNDTNICTAGDTVQTPAGPQINLTISSCLNKDTNTLNSLRCNQDCPGYNSSAGVFCPTSPECQFNDIMWWTVKNFKEGAGTGDGNLFSAESGMLMNYSPLVQ